MARTLLIAGRSGIGKSTLIKTLAEQLKGRAGGFYTEEISGPGGRKGFRIVTFANRSTVVAHVDFKSRSKIGRYGVNPAAIDRVGAKMILQSIESFPIVLIDEIGPLQLFSSKFQNAVLKAIGSPAQVIATVALADDLPWVDALKRLPGVTTWELTFKNRNKMPAEVLQWLATDSH